MEPLPSLSVCTCGDSGQAHLVAEDAPADISYFAPFCLSLFLGKEEGWGFSIPSAESQKCASLPTGLGGLAAAPAVEGGGS